jgi:hypothetical protein
VLSCLNKLTVANAVIYSGRDDAAANEIPAGGSIRELAQASYLIHHQDIKKRCAWRIDYFIGRG